MSPHAMLHAQRAAPFYQRFSARGPAAHALAIVALLLLQGDTHTLNFFWGPATPCLCLASQVSARVELADQAQEGLAGGPSPGVCL